MERSFALIQIEHAVQQLSPGEQLWLIERLARQIRARSTESAADLRSKLAEMAGDREIQKELEIFRDNCGRES